jgi:hypothetical protein
MLGPFPPPRHARLSRQETFREFSWSAHARSNPDHSTLPKIAGQGGSGLLAGFFLASVSVRLHPFRRNSLDRFGSPLLSTLPAPNAGPTGNHQQGREGGRTREVKGLVLLPAPQAAEGAQLPNFPRVADTWQSWQSGTRGRRKRFPPRRLLPSAMTAKGEPRSGSQAGKPASHSREEATLNPTPLVQSLMMPPRSLRMVFNDPEGTRSFPGGGVWGGEK